MNEFRGKSILDVVRKAVGRPAPEYRGGDVCKRLLADFGALQYEVGRIEERLKNLENAIRREQNNLEKLDRQLSRTAIAAGLSLGLSALGTLFRLIKALSRLRHKLQRAGRGPTKQDLIEIGLALVGIQQIITLVEQLKDYDTALNNRNNFHAEAIQLKGELFEMRRRVTDALNEYEAQDCGGTGGV